MGATSLTDTRIGYHGRHAYMYMFCVESVAGMGKAVALIPEGDLLDPGEAFITYYGEDGKVKCDIAYFYMDGDDLILGKRYVDNFCTAYRVINWDNDFYYKMYPNSAKIYVA